MLLLLLSLITSVVLALKRAPPYANAKTVAYPLPDRPLYAWADAKAKALCGYGYAHIYAYAYTTPAATSASGFAMVEFNAKPVPGNSPVLYWGPYMTASTKIYVKGTIGSYRGLRAALDIGFRIYDYKQGKWTIDPYKSWCVTLKEGVYNKTYKISKTYDCTNDYNEVEKYTITGLARGFAACIGGQECEVVVDFYYSQKLVYITYLELKGLGE